MQTFLMALLICSVTMSGVGLLYKAATPLLSRRYAPKGRYYAWLVVVMGLIVPFRPRFGGAIVNVGLPAAVPVSAPVPIPMTQASAFGISTGHLPAHVWQPLENAATAVHINWWQVGFMVWLTGALVFLMTHGVKHYYFVKMTRRWGEAAICPQLLARLQAVAGELGITRPIPLYICQVAGSPMMTGLLRPKMFLPMAEMAPGELQFIFKHELIHYRRKDLLYKYAVLLASAIHWFNPLVYWMTQEIKALCEISCDAQVVAGTDMDKRQRYSEAMIGVARYQSRLKTALSTNFYGGKKDMKKRITSIMDMSKKRVGAVLLCGALALTAGTGFLATTARGAAEAPVEHIPTFTALPDSNMVSLAGGVSEGSFNFGLPSTGSAFERIEMVPELPAHLKLAASANHGDNCPHSLPITFPQDALDEIAAAGYTLDDFIGEDAWAEDIFAIAANWEAQMAGRASQPCHTTYIEADIRAWWQLEAAMDDAFEHLVQAYAEGLFDNHSGRGVVLPW